MADYTLPYTGDEVKQLLAKISEQEQEIETLRDSISPTVLYNANGWTVVAYGHIVLVRVAAIKTGNGSWDATTCPYTLPQDYRPSNTWQAALTTENGASWTGFVRVKSTGVIDVSNCGNAGSADGRYGSLVYPVGA